MTQYDRQITISSAGSRKATVWPAQTLYWSDMVEKLRTAVRGTETLADYLKLPKSQQDELKDVGGFVAGTLAGHRRKAANVTGRDVITLDLDNISAGDTPDVLRRLEGLGCAYAVYSTRKHEESKPRLRVLAPLSRTATSDEYEPLARKLASIIGMSLADPTTFEASRLMYWPSCSSDSHYVFQHGDKPFLDMDGLLATYGDWTNIQEWPEVPGASQTHIRLAAKQGNPTEKRGVVGAFCRQYDIHQAIDTFLPGVYTVTDDGRYTYVGGSTVGGAVIYDDGLFLYSHHATDPCSGRLVNAFDLVRRHKYADEDDEAKAETPVNKMPSYVSMSAFALNDAGVAAVLNRERYERAVEDFGEPAAAGQTPATHGQTPATHGQTPATENDMGWIKQLQISPTTGQPAKSIDNVVIVLDNDPALKGKVAFDEFANRGMVLGSLPWDQRGISRMWESQDDSNIYRYMEKAYSIGSESKINHALTIASHKQQFNDVKKYLERLQWDGTPRLDTLLCDYLGAEDNVYTRAVSRKSFTAAVARALDPGVKYDYMPILVGAQGIGKSTFLRLMGKKWFSDSLQTFDGKDASEMIQGVWVNEIGELSRLSRSETNTVKQFLSRTEDIFREAYGKRTMPYPRRCVFFGTTNDSEFLRDRTGNRRFWPVKVGLFQQTKSVFNDLEQNVDQVYAEAFVRWQIDEPLFLSGEAEEMAGQQQEEHQESNVKEGLIKEFMERHVPIEWEQKSIGDRRLYWSGEFGRIETETVERDRLCAAEIWTECFGSEIKYMKQVDTREINGILSSFRGWESYRGRFGPYSHQRGFVKKKDPLKITLTVDSLVVDT